MKNKIKFVLKKLITSTLLLLFIITACNKSDKIFDSSFLINTSAKYGYILTDISSDPSIDLQELFGYSVSEYYLLNSEDISIGIINSDTPESALEIFDDIKKDRKKTFESENLKGIESNTNTSNKYTLHTDDFYISVIHKENIVFFILSMPPQTDNAKKLIKEIDI